jgi:rubrerythrin
MIFIAGVVPKIKVLDQNPRRCPVCGLHQAYYKRTDHYLSLFFIPIFRVKKGEPIIVCDHCEQADYGLGPDVDRQKPEEASRCRYCGQDVSGDFKFCPYCGKKV